MHSISSDDVTTVRNQSVTDKMSRDFAGSRDTAIHHRRRRDRAIFEHDGPKPDAETNHLARSYSLRNEMMHEYSIKQEPANQNGTAITDRSHNHVAETHKLSSLLPALEDIQTNNDTARSEMINRLPTSGEKTKSASFTSFLRRLTPFRWSSSKRDADVKLTNYAVSDDAGRRANVTRHQSLTTYDVRPSRHRDVFSTEPRRRATASRQDAASQSGGHPLTRHSSDRTLVKSRLTSVLESQEPGGVASSSRRRDSVASPPPPPKSHDAVANRSPPPPAILNLAGPSPLKRGPKFVRHKSQIIAPKPTFGAAPAHSGSRDSRPPAAANSSDDAFAALRGRNDLVRHGSLPALATSTGHSVVTRQHHNSSSRHDVVAASPAGSWNSDESRPLRAKSRPEDVRTQGPGLRARNAAVTSSQSRETATTSRHDCVATARRHNSARQTASPNGARAINIAPRDSGEPASAESRHSSRPVTPPNHVVAKSPSASIATGNTRTLDSTLPSSTLEQSSSSKRDEISTNVTSSSTDRRYISKMPSASPQSSSSASSESRKQVAGKPTTMTESSARQSPIERTETAADITRPIPSPRQNANEIPPTSPSSSSPLSSKNHDQVISQPEPHDLPSAKRNQTESDCYRPVPSPRQKISQMPPPSSPKSPDPVTSDTATVTQSPPPERDQAGSESFRPIPAPRRKARKNRSSSLSTSSSSPRSREQAATTSRPPSKPDETTTSERRQIKPDSIRNDPSSSLQRNPSQTSPVTSQLSAPPDHVRVKNTTTVIIPQDAPSATATNSRYSLPTHREPAARPGPEVLMDDLSESGSRRETANVVVVRPLPALGHVTYDEETKSRSRRETVCLTPNAAVTGSEDEDSMRGRRSSISGLRMASGMKSALRKTARSHSCDRHVSYSNTDTVYRSISLALCMS